MWKEICGYKTDEKDMVHSRPSPELAYETHDSSSSTFTPFELRFRIPFIAPIAIPILCHFQIQRTTWVSSPKNQTSTLWWHGEPLWMLSFDQNQRICLHHCFFQKETPVAFKLQTVFYLCLLDVWALLCTSNKNSTGQWWSFHAFSMSL